MPHKLKCECGGCKTCKHRAYMREWYRRPENTDRVRAWQRQYRQENLEAEQARDRVRGYRPGDITKRSARRLLDYAISKGRVTRQPCEVCGAEPAEAHHDDYAKPLDVRWLCHLHHGQIHQTVNPRPLPAA